MIMTDFDYSEPRDNSRTQTEHTTKSPISVGIHLTTQELYCIEQAKYAFMSHWDKESMSDSFNENDRDWMNAVIISLNATLFKAKKRFSKSQKSGDIPPNGDEPPV